MATIVLMAGVTRSPVVDCCICEPVEIWRLTAQCENLKLREHSAQRSGANSRGGFKPTGAQASPHVAVVPVVHRGE